MAKLYTKNTWQDEILAGDERYDVKADNGDPIESNVQIVLATGVIQEGTAVTAARMNNIEDGLDAVDTRASELHDAMTALLTGWIPGGTWTYASPTSFIIAGDQRQLFPVGTKIKLVQGGITKYFYAINASYSAPNTTVTITGGSDYSLENAEISDVYISYAACPQGFPQWFNYDCRVEGASGSKGTYAESASYSRFAMVGRTLHVVVRKVISDLGSWSGVLYVSYPFPFDPGPNANRPSFNGVIYAGGTAPNTPKAILYSTNTSTNPPSGMGMTFLKTVQTAQIGWHDMAVGDIIAIDDTREIP